MLFNLKLPLTFYCLHSTYQFAFKRLSLFSLPVIVIPLSTLGFKIFVENIFNVYICIQARDFNRNFY